MFVVWSQKKCLSFFHDSRVKRLSLKKLLYRFNLNARVVVKKALLIEVQFLFLRPKVYQRNNYFNIDLPQSWNEHQQLGYDWFVRRRCMVEDKGENWHGNITLIHKNLKLYLQMKSIDKPSVYIRDSVGVRDKLRKLYESGPEKLQVFNEHVAVIALAWTLPISCLLPFINLNFLFWNLIVSISLTKLTEWRILLIQWLNIS